MENEYTNKELYTCKLPYGKLLVTDEGISYGGIKITDYHDQDCCESVYADWEQLKYHVEQINAYKPTKLTIKGVEKMGFLLVFERKKADTALIKVFIPCYNIQNGYYSSDLALIVKNNGTTHEIDISNNVEDDIDEQI